VSAAIPATIPRIVEWLRWVHWLAGRRDEREGRKRKVEAALSNDDGCC